MTVDNDVFAFEIILCRTSVERRTCLRRRWTKIVWWTNPALGRIGCESKNRLQLLKTRGANIYNFEKYVIMVRGRSRFFRLHIFSFFRLHAYSQEQNIPGVSVTRCIILLRDGSTERKHFARCDDALLLPRPYTINDCTNIIHCFDSINHILRLFFSLFRIRSDFCKRT